MDLISVVVPIYKVEAYLDHCIRSIVGQTYQNIEIILVDDGSPDSCGAICDAWAQTDSRIKVIHKENGGLSDARNAGIAIATGDYLSFIDSDDSIEPEFLELLHQALTQTGAEAAECAVSYVNESGEILRHRSAADLSEMNKFEALRRLIQEDGVYQTVWNKLYRREVIDGILFEKGKLNEDEFWTYQVFDRISKLAIVQKPLYNYLQRGSSIIGVGYNIRRLDGLEARFLQMQDLQKYMELAPLLRQTLTLNCMWHYQCAKYLLSGEERARAMDFVREIMAKCPSVPLSALSGKLTHRVWYIMFRTAPDFTVWLRNKMKIGL